MLIEEQEYRVKRSGVRFRPFSESAEVRSRGYSRALQRALCDFGADHAFARVAEKMKEHYGIEIPSNAARQITEKHAAAMEPFLMEQPVTVPEVAVVIAQSDGSMLPIVETGDPSSVAGKRQDKRKKKRLFWKEARLSLAHAQGSSSPYFAGTLGTVEVAGQQLLSCVRHAGAKEKTQVHCVGDDATWIANQVEEQFGARGHYLIDFYHLCEYLSAAAPHCCGDGEALHWLEQQKEAMKLNQSSQVLLALQPHLESSDTEEKEPPIKACYRYLKNRPTQLDYRNALSHDLPIGSGEIESAHRYVLQERLKIAGAWWTTENAKHMINLRVCRANHHWETYWKKAA